MFLCPTTGSRLIKARAGGGTIWYSPDSDGRMLTVATSRHFFSEDKTREIWMRSDRVEAISENACPSCQKSMRNTPLPNWIGSSPIDVCRTCRIFWLDSSSFDEVPRGSQLPHERGDSTLVKDLGAAYVEHHRIKSEKENLRLDGAVIQPDSIAENVLSFLRLPIERSNRAIPKWPIVSAATIVLMILIQIFATDGSFAKDLGFYPNDLFKNYGLNLLSHVFIHAGWFHLISNCYFTYILSDDVEEDLGSKKFIGLLVFTIIVVALTLTITSGHRDIPHIGYSGVVMSLFAYYGLQFPEAKIIWLLPNFRVVQFNKLYAPMLGWSWFQFRALWVALFYLAGDIIYYFAMEASGNGSVSFSGHIVGFAAGALFWFIAAPRSFKKEAPDILESRLDSLVSSEVTSQKPSLKSPPKQIE